MIAHGYPFVATAAFQYTPISESEGGSGLVGSGGLSVFSGSSLGRKPKYNPTARAAAHTTMIAPNTTSVRLRILGVKQGKTYQDSAPK
jgi:hypothetical protein